MKKFKKVLSAAIVGVMLVSCLAACGKSSSSAEPETEAEVQDTEETVIVEEPEEFETAAEIVEETKEEAAEETEIEAAETVEEEAEEKSSDFDLSSYEVWDNGYPVVPYADVAGHSDYFGDYLNLFSDEISIEPSGIYIAGAYADFEDLSDSVFLVDYMSEINENLSLRLNIVPSISEALGNDGETFMSEIVREASMTGANGGFGIEFYFNGHEDQFSGDVDFSGHIDMDTGELIDLTLSVSSYEGATEDELVLVYPEMGLNVIYNGYEEQMSGNIIGTYYQYQYAAE